MAGKNQEAAKQIIKKEDHDKSHVHVVGSGNIHEKYIWIIVLKLAHKNQLTNTPFNNRNIN